MTVLDIVLTKLGLQDVTVTIEIAIAEVEQLIKNYCSISEIPGELLFTWANMAVDVINTQTAKANNESIAGGVLASVSMGDVSYSFDNETSTQKYLNDIVGNYTAQLNKFRKGLFGNA